DIVLDAAAGHALLLETVDERGGAAGAAPLIAPGFDPAGGNRVGLEERARRLRQHCGIAAGQLASPTPERIDSVRRPRGQQRGRENERQEYSPHSHAFPPNIVASPDRAIRPSIAAESYSGVRASRECG